MMDQLILAADDIVARTQLTGETDLIAPLYRPDGTIAGWLEMKETPNDPEIQNSPMDEEPTTLA